MMTKAEHADGIEIVVGRKGGDHVSITIQGRMYPHADDIWDGNWLVSPIELAVDGFRGELAAGLRTTELIQFREQLDELYSSLAGEATFDSMETWLKLRIKVNRRGELQVTGVANEPLRTGNNLEFSIDGLDQTDLTALIAALRAVEAKYPVRGRSG